MPEETINQTEEEKFKQKFIIEELEDYAERIGRNKERAKIVFHLILSINMKVYTIEKIFYKNYRLERSFVRNNLRTLQSKEIIDVKNYGLNRSKLVVVESKYYVYFRNELAKRIEEKNVKNESESVMLDEKEKATEKGA